MTDKVHYLELRPAQFAERLAARPVGYLPLGTIEWHGPQNPLGGDALISNELFSRAARRFGGIVFPPLFLGPDRITMREGKVLNGMDFLYRREGASEQQLTGSCYWVSWGFFLQLVENVIAQAARAGFRCIVADGHGPSRGTFCSYAKHWEEQFGMRLIGATYNIEEGWATQRDHAAKNETSLLLAARSDLVDMGTLPTDRKEWPVGVGGEDPRDSSPEFGEELFEKTLALIGRALEKAGV